MEDPMELEPVLWDRDKKKKKKKQGKQAGETKEERRARKDKRRREKERERRKSKWDMKDGGAENGPMRPPTKGRRIYVGNFCYEGTMETLQGLFKGFGPIRGVEMSYDDMTNRHKGFAFIDFEEADHAEKAIEAMNGYNFGGRALRVNKPTHLAACVEDNLPVHVVKNVPSDTPTEDATLSAYPKGRLDLMQRLMRSGAGERPSIASPMMPSPMDGAATAPPVGPSSRCIVLRNVIGIEESDDASVGREVKDECSKYGNVETICIYDTIPPTPSHTAEVLIYVLFKELSAAATAKGKLNGRKFGGRLVAADYCPTTDLEQAMEGHAS